MAALVMLASWAAPKVRAELNEFRDRAPRVLLLGDSILDQHGGSAAVLLRQAGIETEVHGAWGTGLLTRNQYDHGHTILDGPRSDDDAYNWLVEGPRFVDQMRPDLVVVYLDHNYWPPMPRDRDGNEIRDLRSAAGQEMIGTQARVFIELLRQHGAEVVFVAPVPQTGTDPAADNPIWAGYLPVLRDMHVGIIDIRTTLTGRDGRRVETKPDCAGDEAAIRPNNDLHLTRLGAGRAATVLANGIAQRVGRDLGGEPAPGDHTVTLVPTVTGNGYWIVGCDGGVYRFGDAPEVSGEHPPAGDPVVGAARAGTDGLWLVTRAGRILRLGHAKAVSFGARPGAFVEVAGTPDGRGLVAVTATGRIAVAGSVPFANDTGLAAGVSVTAGVVASPVVALAMHPSGAGYWIVTADGHVHAFGAAETHGNVEVAPLVLITGIAASPTGNGYWVARADGTIEAFGDAPNVARVVKEDASKGGTAALTPDTPTVAIVSAGWPSGSRVWAVDDNGAVHARATAPELGGTGNLALFTP